MVFFLYEGRFIVQTIKITLTHVNLGRSQFVVYEMRSGLLDSLHISRSGVCIL